MACDVLPVAMFWEDMWLFLVFSVAAGRSMVSWLRSGPMPPPSSFLSPSPAGNRGNITLFVQYHLFSWYVEIKVLGWTNCGKCHIATNHPHHPQVLWARTRTGQIWSHTSKLLRWIYLRWKNQRFLEGQHMQHYGTSVWWWLASGLSFSAMSSISSPLTGEECPGWMTSRRMNIVSTTQKTNGCPPMIQKGTRSSPGLGLPSPAAKE